MPRLCLSPRRWAHYAAALAVLAGCGEDDEITRYRAPKPKAAAEAAPGAGTVSPEQATDRMLAAIVPGGRQAWFFKLTGPKDAVAEVDPLFRQFLASLKFEDGADEAPTWTLPPGWNEGPGDEIRFATIDIPAQPDPLELTVTALGKPEDDGSRYILENINRWRGQMQLGPLSAGQLAAESEELTIPAGTATLVNLLGIMSDRGMGPFSGGPALDAPAPSPRAENAPPTAAAANLTYEAPSEWAAGKMTQMREAAFEVRDGEAGAEITVIRAAGELLPNVNRWRMQLGLPEMTAEELGEAVLEIDVAGGRGPYVELLGPEGAARKATFAAVAEREEQQWFFKMTGDAALVERERERFLAFVKSVEFATEAGNGD